MKVRWIVISAAVAGLCGGLLSPAAAQVPLSALRTELEALASGHKGTVGIAIIDLASDDSLSIRGDEPFPTASIIKVPVLVELFHLIESDVLSLDDPMVLLEADKKPGSGVLQFLSAPHQLTIGDAAFLMIAHSDNTASNLVIDKTGIRAVGARMDSLGLPRTKLHSKLFLRETSVAPDSSVLYGVGVTTPREMARLFAMIHDGTAVSPEASEQMIEMLQNQFYRSMIPRHLPDVTIANKTGSVNAARNDCGILFGEARDVVLCVFTKDNEDQSWRTDNAAEVLIADIARLVHTRLIGSSRR